jgi:predicted acylesterase/phospholipase RssA
MPPVCGIALSGGGQNGAWGAGFLNGWSDRAADKRPDFNIVTGVSTGALQATFVFVNSASANQAMERGYRSAGVKSLIEMRPILSVPFCSSLARAQGLQAMMKDLVSNDLIDEVARRSEGRRLLVGTINLDSGLLSVWDMVAIARRGEYDLYRKVIFASASEPPVFPPVCIGGAYHMDGGVREQVFVPRTLEYFAAKRALRLNALRSAASKDPTLAVNPQDFQPVRMYFLINGVLDPGAACVQPRLLDIAVRSVDLLSNEGRIGSLWKSWAILQRWAGPDLFWRLTSLPQADAIQGKSSIEMTQADVDLLYRRGYAAASGATLPWLTSPDCLPDFFTNEELKAR